MRILYIGGTGEISFDCIHESVRAGHEVHVYNRGGPGNADLPKTCQFIRGDINNDTAYAKLAGMNFDAVCQFRLFSTDAVARDIKLFAGHCGQYVFISSASAYHKPVRTLPITEATPLHNPHWEYSRNKAAMEKMLQSQDKLPYTIVRPSHTYRTRMPATGVGDDTNLSRVLRGKPVVVHGDGSSLWTITHARDFAPPFVKLLGNKRALGETFHITAHMKAWTWNEILEASAAALGTKDFKVVHVPSDTLVKYKPEWTGPLLGDKSESVMFDNSKLMSVAGKFDATIDPWKGMKLVQQHHPLDLRKFDAEMDALLDRIAADQSAVG